MGEEKLRALSRSCEYVVKATEAGDVSELWAVRFDVMGRPYNSRTSANRSPPIPHR